MRRPLAILAALAAALPAAAGQPISRSMAECHVILGLAADLFEDRRPAQEIESLRRWSDGFAVAAVAQARAEGRPEAERHISQIVQEVRPGWEDRQTDLLQLRDTLDWLAYCRALGRDRGIVE